jgi:hypothetical protein
MNAEAEQQRAVAVIDVPFAAILGARDIRSKITGGPGLQLAAASPGVRNQLADQRQIVDHRCRQRRGARPGDRP